MVNDTNKPINFYILSPNADPQRVVLKPGEEGSYNAENVLYDSIVGKQYKPVVQEVDNNGSYRFSLTGKQISIIGRGANLRPTS